MKSLDPDLIALFRAGNTAAFDTIYGQYAGRVLAFARRLTGWKSSPSCGMSGGRSEESKATEKASSGMRWSGRKLR